MNQCKCGSITHLKTNSETCPLNPIFSENLRETNPRDHAPWYHKGSLWSFNTSIRETESRLSMIIHCSDTSRLFPVCYLSRPYLLEVARVLLKYLPDYQCFIRSKITMNVMCHYQLSGLYSHHKCWHILPSGDYCNNIITIQDIVNGNKYCKQHLETS